MISVLICSANPSLLEQVSKNVTETIGIAFEILHYDNRSENKGICQVYNLLAEKARYQYLCFIHEDVLFGNLGWGKILIDHFNEIAGTGLIGIAGSKYKSNFYSGWYTHNKLLDCGNIIHRDVSGEARNFFSPSDDHRPQEVVCIDGVFMATTKTAWQKHRFSDYLQGFHFYDLDYSIRVAASSRVMVVYDIEITHLTQGGDFGNRWVEGAFVFHDLHADLLPLSLEENLADNPDDAIIKLWLDYLKNFSISWANKWQWLSRQRLFTRPIFYYSILKFLFYKPFGGRYLHHFIKRR